MEQVRCAKRRQGDGVCAVENLTPHDSLNERALNDGCEYVYQSNDDVELITRGWAKLFVNRHLATCTPRGYVDLF
jgi:hypothetical protein